MSKRRGEVKRCISQQVEKRTKETGQKQHLYAYIYTEGLGVVKMFHIQVDNVTFLNTHRSYVVRAVFW